VFTKLGYWLAIFNCCQFRKVNLKPTFDSPGSSGGGFPNYAAHGSQNQEPEYGADFEI
jgi:hypothetical protein